MLYVKMGIRLLNNLIILYVKMGKRNVLYHIDF